MRRLLTEAGAALDGGTPWAAYPRPQLRREDWLCLNGPWELTAGGTRGTILVPFCPESLLSGWDAPTPPGTELVYRRFFTVPAGWKGRRVVLHFGAVMRIAVVRVNGEVAATHEEGYFPFSADVTDLLRPGENELTVTAVNDLSRQHLWGKQRADRGGMWYTPCSGIWQTVWLEPVPEAHIRSLRIGTGPDWVGIAAEGVSEGTVTLEGRAWPLVNGAVRIPIDAPRLWSPEDPQLYDFTVESGADRVSSYFALRTLSVERVRGVPRLCLNGRPYFFHALLDQGYWSDGLYTPADPGAYERDILAAKALGFNTLRKHIKIEPERFYYDCDRLGMLVFQDMVNAGEYHYIRDTVLPTLGFQRRRDARLNRDPAARKNFLAAMEAAVALLRDHPSIVLWTIFNEGWGQFEADEAYHRLWALDDTRFIDAASGWYHQTVSDVDSRHIYFQRLRLGGEDRPQLLSEFGGWSLKLPEHSANLKETYGYRKYADRESFVRDLRAMYLDRIVPLARQGLCGAVYTQLSDVEDETNGLLTFDRRVRKLSPEEFSDVAQALRAAVTE